jgi:glutamate 5-kinase
MPRSRIVLKLGTNVLISGETRVVRQRLKLLAETVHKLKKAGHEVLIVTSGAVGMGRKSLKLAGLISVAEKQASAAVGQTLLMKLYQSDFGGHGIKVGQVLVTARDFSLKESLKNLSDTLETLLRLDVVPIINENDSVATQELGDESGQAFGDNDMLSALLASGLKADLLVLFTDVDGVFSANPKLNKTAERLKLVDNIDQLGAIQIQDVVSLGRGGMAAKLNAVRRAVEGGVTTWITSGVEPLSFRWLNRVFSKAQAKLEERPVLDLLSQRGSLFRAKR